MKKEIIILIIIIFIIWYLEPINEIFNIENNLKKIIIPDIIGELGDQLFIISSAYAFSKNNNYKLLLDNRNNLESNKLIFTKIPGVVNYCVSESYDEVLSKLCEIDILNFFKLNEDNYLSENIINESNNKNILLTGGYYQEVKYFDKYRNELLELLEPSNEILDKINDLSIKNNINFNKDYLIAIYIKLDDELMNGDKKVYDQDEYNIIISKLPEHMKNNINSKFIIFSNNISKTKDIFNKSTIDENKIIYIKEEDYIELFLMAKCNEYIASFSTFNWWGIYLNKNIDKVKIYIYWKQNTKYREDFYKKYEYFKNLENYFTLKNNLKYEMYNFLALGHNCGPAAALRHLNIRKFALPFDWVESSIDILEECFKDNFSKYHTNLRFNESKTRLIDEYGFQFPHDYPTIDNNIVEDGFIEEKVILDNWKDNYDKVKEKYDRRIKRFLNILNDNKKIIVLCKYSTNDVYRLYELLKKYYNNDNIIFVNSSSEVLSNDLIKNCDTEKNGNWNDTIIWKETIDSLIYNDMKINI